MTEKAHSVAAIYHANLAQLERGQPQIEHGEVPVQGISPAKQGFRRAGCGMAADTSDSTGNLGLS